jgi:hypothetical protein
VLTITQPTQGQELISPELSTALMIETEFAQQEWDEFGISSLRMGTYIKAGESYFNPAARYSFSRHYLERRSHVCIML